MERKELSHEEMWDQFADTEDDLCYASACPRCGGELVKWSEEVPCCGGEFECVDILRVAACPACEIVGSDW